MNIIRESIISTWTSNWVTFDEFHWQRSLEFNTISSTTISYIIVTSIARYNDHCNSREIDYTSFRKTTLMSNREFNFSHMSFVRISSLEFYPSQDLFSLSLDGSIWHDCPSTVWYGVLFYNESSASSMSINGSLS